LSVVAGASVAVAVALLAVHAAAPSDAPRPRVAGPLAVAGLPATPRAGLHVPPTHALDERGVARWAPLRTATYARARPSPHSPALGRLAARTPEGTSNLVLVLGRAVDRDGHVWIRARLPLLRHRTGWVPRAALGGYGTVRTELVVDRARLRATLLRNGRPVFRAPVGIGRAGTPTPAGRFYVRDRVTSYASPTYGPLAFGTSARSAVLTDWPGGGFVGIHGTDHPDLVPGRVSHGCIRLRNRDILRLARLMPVGTPLTVV
jgi:lipoprotein-anchoring transpeptidase ErfK/SrfK